MIKSIKESIRLVSFWGELFMIDYPSDEPLRYLLEAFVGEQVSGVLARWK